MQTAPEVGVIVARFQTPVLTDAHRDLIESVKSRHERLVIVLGHSPCKVTRNNPLDFEARKQMLLASYADAIVLYIKDCADDGLWSRRLDALIQDVIGVGQRAVLYGGRDSFIPYYSGRYPTTELESTRIISATEKRREAAIKPKPSADFRAGAVWAVSNQFPVAIPTVDVAIVDRANSRVLLARKEDEKHYRFVGGFAEPGSPCYEHDAMREVKEETGLEIKAPRYLGSFHIDDWRYRKEVNQIKTLFFVADYPGGEPKANDDICEVRWQPFDYDKLKELVAHVHQPLLHLLFQKASTQ